MPQVNKLKSQRKASNQRKRSLIVYIFTSLFVVFAVGFLILMRSFLNNKAIQPENEDFDEDSDGDAKVDPFESHKIDLQFSVPNNDSFTDEPGFAQIYQAAEDYYDTGVSSLNPLNPREMSPRSDNDYEVVNQEDVRESDSDEQDSGEEAGGSDEGSEEEDEDNSGEDSESDEEEGSDGDDDEEEEEQNDEDDDVDESDLVKEDEEEGTFQLAEQFDEHETLNKPTEEDENTEMKGQPRSKLTSTETQP